MKTYTQAQVIAKLKTFVRQYETATDAARAMGCTQAQLSVALNGGHLTGKVLKAVGLETKKVYADV